MTDGMSQQPTEYQSYGQSIGGSYGQSNSGVYGVNFSQQNQPNQYGGVPATSYSSPAPGVHNLSHNMPGYIPPYQTPNSGLGFGFGTGAGYSSQSQSYQQQSNTQQTNYSSSTPMAQYQGTVRQYPNFNATQDAEALKKAMRGFGCDDKTVMNILCNRSNAQRQQIRQAFKTMYGKDLIAELISELKGNFEDLIVALLYTPAEFDVRELDYAMRGLGTTESTLIEIMTTRTNAEIQAIKQAYKIIYHTELEDALSGETSGHFRRMLVSLTVGGRDESSQTDRNRAVQQAKQLYEDGEKRWGTVESTFNSTMIMNNPSQLQAIFAEYQKLTGHDIEQAVRNEFSGDILDGMLALVKIGKNRPAFFAEKAYLAMKGLGTDDRSLIRVVVSRCEKDTVQIKQEYQRLYKTTLETDISGDTSGKYKEGLLTLLRG
uniref:Annexin n=1 Tax=Romanomermis culicivorax TaxID=13658 RepID=A0A915ISI8_ROMCU